MSQDSQDQVDLSPDFPQPPPSVADPDELKEIWAAVYGKKTITADTVRPALEEKQSRVYNPELRNGVLIPLGIVVEDQPGLDVGTLARAHFDTEPIHDYAAEFPGYHFWVNSERVKIFMAQHGALVAQNTAEFTRVASTRRNLLPPCFDPITGRIPVRNIWYIQRWMDLPLPTASDICMWPPILRDGYVPLLGSAARERLSPHLSYWLSFVHLGTPYMRQLQTVLRGGIVFCSYLTIEWYMHEENQSEVDRAALASAVVLYNRFRLRESALSLDPSGGGKSITEMDATRNVKHFCITFGATSDFTVWLVEPSYSVKATPIDKPRTTAGLQGPAAGLHGWDSANEDRYGTQSTHWNGCKAQKMVAGSLHRECDVGALADWINEIHRWALEVHLPAVVTDAEALAGLDSRRGQEQQPMWAATTM